MTIKLDTKTCLWRGDEPAIGSGKADLLDAIIATGSISAAGRAMNMSYRRAWLLVDTMNRCFREPLVKTSAGGEHGGGAAVTEAGLAVLAEFRRMQQATDAAAQPYLDVFADLLRDPQEDQTPQKP
ncbi:MAG: bacterial regulatory helix-turn-helix, lysR family protein [Massilia sp.]|nr:bacterial regulatory helix-turn-helix, lysR family protein [Massilia sp.]